MDKFIADDEALSNHTRFALSTGSRGAARAPAYLGDEVELVKSGPKPDIWETHRPTIRRFYLDEDNPWLLKMGSWLGPTRGGQGARSTTVPAPRLTRDRGVERLTQSLARACCWQLRECLIIFSIPGSFPHVAEGPLFLLVF